MGWSEECVEKGAGKGRGGGGGGVVVKEADFRDEVTSGNQRQSRDGDGCVLRWAHSTEW